MLPCLLLSILCGGSVHVERHTPTDPARDREVPVKVYSPDFEADVAVPLVLLSHGLGGSREGLGYIAEHLAANGYLVVALQHAGSDEAIWKDVPPRERMAAMRAAVRNGRNAVERPRDVSFVIDELLAREADWAADLPRVNPEQIGIAGHSFGGHTTLAVAGMTMRGGVSFADPRVKAAVALSPPGEKGGYDEIAIPVMTVTGTRDTSPLSDETPESRMTPFREIEADSGILIVFDGATHGGIGGGVGGRRGERSDPQADRRMHALIQQATLLFLDAHLRGDADAAQALKALPEMIGDAGTVETKDAN